MLSFIILLFIFKFILDIYGGSLIKYVVFYDFVIFLLFYKFDVDKYGVAVVYLSFIFLYPDFDKFTDIGRAVDDGLFV